MVVLSEVSGGSSSSLNQDHKYDVFLSFRGVDTRYGFTDHLHKALLDANLTTFLDDKEIETGEDLKPELENAIKESRASVIVLSKNYANSSWCLDELVLILEQQMASNQIVIPIFYHVEPTHVRKQENTFGDAMTKHKQTMEAEINVNKKQQLGQKIELWIKALIQVAALKGKDVHGRLETEFIEETVREVYLRLHLPLWNPLPLLIGMEYSIDVITSWLKYASSDTGDILSVVGMSGIGKTSLAKYVYGLHCREFDTSSYIEDISRRCADKLNGLLNLQSRLCGDISKTSSIQAHDVSTYTSKIENALARKKVLLVLDDIDSLDQLDALIGSKGFHPGCKIIVTTKDNWLTQSCALFKTNVKPRHVEHFLQGLEESASQKLLCFHAFMCDSPKTGYEEVLEKLLRYCQGHPLALEILGKSLHNRDVAYWEGCMEGLKKEVSSPVNNVLRMSFDSLPSKNDKDLFEHIACFFVGMDRDVTETILKGCGINTRSGITNLIDRCLLSVGWNNKLIMHRLLQEMGRSIVREESPTKPWKRSRLWCHEESFKVLKHETVKANLVGLALDMRMLEKEKLYASIELTTNALSKMDCLMLLQLNYVKISGSFEKFPEELRWLCMHGFPSKSISLNYPMKNLVVLDMSYSNIESFDICYSNLERLECRQKILNLSFCKQLCSLSGFDELPALESLILTNCTRLIEICESVGHCVELVHIDLSYCNKLKRLPRTIGMLKKVKTMNLDGCDLRESPIKIWGMDSQEMVKANNIDINTKTSSSDVLQDVPSILKLFAISLPFSLVSLSLANSNLSTESFPMDFCGLSMLKELSLDENPIVSLPNCVRSLPRLEILSMQNCKMLTSVEHPPRTLRALILESSELRFLRKVVFNPEMSPLLIHSVLNLLAPSSFEFEGLVKIQPMESVDENLLRSLGWTKLGFLSGRFIKTRALFRGSEISEIQMYYEFGIFSTIYGGKEMPNWIRRRSKGPSISFTIPPSPNKLRGLNFCAVQSFRFPKYEWLQPPFCRYFNSPMITVLNVTKNRTWIYKHYIETFNVRRKCFTFLSHWMFGENDMEVGDQVTIVIGSVDTNPGFDTSKCGVRLVFDDGKTGEEEDALGYYKSWNHIIGGDLSAHQTTTGEYLLDIQRVVQHGEICAFDLLSTYRWQLFGYGPNFKEKKVHFRALSQRKSRILGHVHEGVKR